MPEEVDISGMIDGARSVGDLLTLYDWLDFVRGFVNN